jgi:hypothetical protein
MCNLYSITTNQAAIAALFRVLSQYVGNLPPLPGVFPDYMAPVIRDDAGVREMIMMRWGMPPPPRIPGPPVTNIRNTSSPHWRAWLKPENRCLVPFNSFAEYAPEPNPETKKKDVVWFALDDDRPSPPSPGSGPHSTAIAGRNQSRCLVRTTSLASSRRRRPPHRQMAWPLAARPAQTLRYPQP